MASFNILGEIWMRRRRRRRGKRKKKKGRRIGRKRRK